jgi:hypothetical protein
MNLVHDVKVAHSTNREQAVTFRDASIGGVGLGLAIVKTCIESCRNRQPAGMEVDLRLQTASREQPAPDGMTGR